MKSFRIRNIKSFIDSKDIEIAPLTILVGQNSCGKSSLLRFPAVLAQSFKEGSGPISFNGQYVDYGFFENIAHNKNGKPIVFSYSYDVDTNNTFDSRVYREISQDERFDKDYIKNVETVTMCVEMDKLDKQVYVKSVSMSVSNKKLVVFGISEGVYYIDLLFLKMEDHFSKCNYSFHVDKIDFDHGGFPMYEMGDLFLSICRVVLSGEDIQVDRKYAAEIFRRLYQDANPFGEDKLSKTDKRIKLIKNSFEYISAVMSHVYMAFQDDAYTLKYIGPFREAPARLYRDEERVGEGVGVGVHGENVGSMLIRDYRKNKRLVDSISSWLEPTMGYRLAIDELTDSGFYRISLENKQGIKSDISDVGFGVSQVLPIITQVIKNEDSWGPIGIFEAGELTLVEQPELHLHPAAQSKLADLFVNCICSKRYKGKFILETHSEHFIRKLQVLISDKKCKLTSDMVKIYYVDKNSKGIATVKEMKLSENGKFETTWPKGFFDQAYQLTMDLLKNTSVNV